MTDDSEKNFETEIDLDLVVMPQGRTGGATTPIRYEKDVETSARVRRLAAIGLSKNATAIAARITLGELNRHYLEEYMAGQAGMQEVVATAAMEQVMAGNPQMIQFVAKTKLGWNETNIVEHVGEVRAVVSAVPLTKEEFAARYLEKSEDSEE